MIVENGHKKAYLKKLVKDDNAKKKTRPTTITPTQIKSLEYLIVDQKL